MGEQDLADGLRLLKVQLACGCEACCIWRRLGSLIGVGHQDVQFRSLVKEEVGDLICAILDKAPSGTAPSLAEGESSAKEGEEPAGLSGGKKGSPERKEAEDSKEEVEEAAKEERKDRAKSPKKSRDKHSGHRSRSRRRRRKERADSSPGPEKRCKTAPSQAPRKSKKSPDPEWEAVKEEPLESSKVTLVEAPQSSTTSRSSRPEPKDRKAIPSSSSRAPLRLTEKGSESGTKRREEKEPAEEKQERPPGQWEVDIPRRPQPPNHPPPGWSQRKPASGRNRGIERKLRLEDIQKYGFSSRRKEWREKSKR